MFIRIEAVGVRPSVGGFVSHGIGDAEYEVAIEFRRLLDAAIGFQVSENAVGVRDDDFIRGVASAVEVNPCGLAEELGAGGDGVLWTP